MLHSGAIKCYLVWQHPALQWRHEWARWRLKSPASWWFVQPLVQEQIKENIKAPRLRPLWVAFIDDSWFFNLYAHYAAQYPSTFRVASTEAVSYDLSRGLPTGIFVHVSFIFVQHVRIVLQCKPDVKISCVILCWIYPGLSLSLSLTPMA